MISFFLNSIAQKYYVCCIHSLHTKNLANRISFCEIKDMCEDCTKSNAKPVRGYIGVFLVVFVLVSFLHATYIKLVFSPQLSIIDSRQARKNLTTKFKKSCMFLNVVELARGRVFGHWMGSLCSERSLAE